MAFTHLHVHSEHSPLDGMIRIQDGFEHVAGMGQDALAITDHGGLSGAWAAQNAADRAGVKFIAGMEAYVAIGSRHERNAHWVDADDNSTDEDSERTDDKADATITDGLKKSRYFHLTLLARTPEGWTNLVRLNNAAQESVWSKPRIDFDLLAEHAEGLIVLTGCIGGPVLGPLSRRARVLERAERLQDIADQAERLHREALTATVVPYAPDLTAVAAVLDESGCADVGEAAAAAASTWAEADSARSHLRTLIGAVGSDNVYVELMEHGIPAESAILADAVALAREEGVGIVATNDAHHLTADDAQAHAAWLLVQSKSTLENPKYQFHGSGFHLRSETEMRALHPESWWQEACDTTNTIADRCAERTLPTWRNLIPRFPTPDGFTTNREYLFHLLRAGASGRYGGIDQATRDRVLTETGVVEQAGMVDYFLIVHDLVTWARSDAPARPGGPAKEPISVGPGRGSAGGSEIAYLLGITQIEPRRYGLLFERFYEAGRSEPPDIDLDFPESRRDEVIQYLRERWGHGNVAFLGTFTMSRMKKAIDDAARVLDQAPLGARMKKLVPNAEAKPMPAAQLMDPAMTAAAEYRHLVESDPAAQRIHELASSFEDVVAGFGMHASGIIVSSQPLGDLVPLRKDSRGWVMQWSGLDAEQFGLLKVDVLGLRTLDVIDQAVKYIAQTTGEQLDWTKIPDPDVPHTGRDAERVDAAWRVIADGRTAGLFQLDSPPMTELAMRVRARSLAEHSATIALYRPGPMGMGMHDTYARRKRGEEQISYRDFTSDPKEQELIASVLAETFGVIVFQEQIMRIGSVVAGFDATGRSKLRKATSKKKKDVMAAVGQQFMASGVIATTDSATSVQSAPFRPETVQALWDTMVSFAEYAFNASHSTAYGLLSYVTAFLKGTWPAEFAAAMLATTTSTSKDEKRIMVLRALQREGVTVLPPDVNVSQARTAPEGKMAIRFGLSEIKGLGKPGSLIAQARDLHGPFTSLHDIVRLVNADRSDGEKTTKAVITQSALRTLIDSGAADAFGPRLGLTAVSAALAAGPVPVPPMEWGVLERATRQRDRLLVSLGDSPMTLLSDQLDQVIVPAADPRFDAKPVRVEEIPNTSGEVVDILAIIGSWSEKNYSRGRMANVRLDGVNASIPGTIWDDVLTQVHQTAEHAPVPRPGDVVVARGKVRYREVLSDPSDPDSDSVAVKELTVLSVRRVTLLDPQTGGFPATTFPRIDFTPAPVPEAVPFVQAAEPAPDDVHDGDQSDATAARPTAPSTRAAVLDDTLFEAVSAAPVLAQTAVLEASAPVELQNPAPAPSPTWSVVSGAHPDVPVYAGRRLSEILVRVRRDVPLPDGPDGRELTSEISRTARTTGGSAVTVTRAGTPVFAVVMA